MLNMLLESRIWKLLCSLKMTIVLASVAAFLTIGGSVLIPFNPVFPRLIRCLSDSGSLMLLVSHSQ